MKKWKYAEDIIGLCILVAFLCLLLLSWNSNTPGGTSPVQTEENLYFYKRLNKSKISYTSTPLVTTQSQTSVSNHSTNQFTTVELSKPETDPLHSALIKLPWMIQRNVLPNFFKTFRNASSIHSYRSAVAVYIHNNKAAGTTIKNCMLKTLPKYGKHIWHVLTDCVRVSLRPGSVFDALMGDYAFGVCDDLSRPCAYFTFVRDPYERTISSYSYCRRARADQLCRALDPWKVTINEWAIHQGNFFMQQLFFNPKFCSGFKEYYNRSIIASDMYLQTPFWFRERVILLNLLSEDEYDALVNFTLKHVEEWFAFIGLTSEFDVSLELMEAVFGLPYRKECRGLYDNYSGSYSNLFTVYRNNTLDELTRSKVHTIWIETLKADERVNRALSADYKLFLKAKQIFNKQKLQFYKSNVV